MNLQAHALTVGDLRNSTFAGVVSGSGGTLMKSGAGTLTLSGNNTYSGGTVVASGTLVAATPTAQRTRI